MFYRMLLGLLIEDIYADTMLEYTIQMVALVFCVFMVFLITVFQQLLIETKFLRFFLFNFIKQKSVSILISVTDQETMLHKSVS